MSKQTEPVNLVVTPKTKQKWKSAAEEHSEADNLSQLIRISVSRELSDESGSANPSEVSVEPSAEVLEGIREIKGAIGDMDERLSALESDEQRAGYDLQRVLFRLIPEHVPESPIDPHANPGKSVETLASQTGEDVETVRSALKALSKGNPKIAGKMDDKETRYFRRVNEDV